MEPVPTSPKYRVKYPFKHKQETAQEERHRTLFFAFIIAVIVGFAAGITSYMVGRAFFPATPYQTVIPDIRRPISSPVVLTDEVQRHVDFALFSVVSPEMGELGYTDEDVIQNGIAVSNDGIVMVSGEFEVGKQIRLLVGDGSVALGTIMAFDPLTDVSFVQVDSRSVVPVSGVNTGSIEPGDRLFGVRRSPGNGLIWESGFVSQTNSVDGATEDTRWPSAITTTLTGENIPVFTQDGGFVGFAQNGVVTPYDALNTGIQLYFQTGEIERFSFGIEYVSLDSVSGLSDESTFGIDSGALVTASNNEKILVGDVIVEVNGVRITDQNPPYTLFALAGEIDSAEVVLVRQNQEITKTVDLVQF